eukprot:COSAG02_NODE_391_length_23237_cov_42.467672_15_plen_181_part_00
MVGRRERFSGWHHQWSVSTWMLILADADVPQQLPQLPPGKLSAGVGDGSRVPRAATGARGISALPTIRSSQQGLDAEVRQLQHQLRAKDINAQHLLGTLSDSSKQAAPNKRLHSFDDATVMAARGTGLQPAELAEAARIGLTPEDLEQLIEDLAAKEFHHLEQCVAPWKAVSRHFLLLAC